MGKRKHVPLERHGYYAVVYSGVLRFYVVRAGKGKWEGRKFLNRYASDNELRISRTEQDAVFASIAADTAGAIATFANELTRCARCARMLTDETSRERHYGPECASILGIA